MSSSLPQAMDSLLAPLNPCSVETIQEPVRLGDRTVWPLALSCYQLDEAAGHRQGHLELYHVEVPDIVSAKASLPLQFGQPDVVLDSLNSSGILDAKWSQVRGRLFATAHASGEIKLHRLRIRPGETTETCPARFELEFLGQSQGPSSAQSGIPPLCLSVNWAIKTDEQLDDDPMSALPIVSTYSNGKVAIHDVVFLESGSVQLVERDSWEAHNMFTSPAEVWSADFCGQQSVISCGDEGKVKLWDVRATTRPMQVLSPFEAGATCASTHPRHEYLVACGSYDETLCVYDIRFLKAPVSRSKELGGGIWRIKWHPYMDHRLLVAAMHGGCRVINVQNWETLGTYFDDSKPQFSFQVTKKFTEHESMAYGADWLVCKHPTRNGFFEAAASCSFYDRAVFLWDTLS
jgi:diphthamide biosynthesis protein 7